MQRKTKIVSCHTADSPFSIPCFCPMSLGRSSAPCHNHWYKQFLRSGAERFWMGTPLEHCNFPSHSIFAISAPHRATIIGTSSSYGAERNAFGWEHHLKIAISLAILYFPSPLRSVPQSLVQAVPTERSGTLLDGNTT